MEILKLGIIICVLIIAATASSVLAGGGNGVGRGFPAAAGEGDGNSQEPFELWMIGDWYGKGMKWLSEVPGLGHAMEVQAYICNIGLAHK